VAFVKYKMVILPKLPQRVLMIVILLRLLRAQLFSHYQNL